ncbi:peptidyl-alpha-hydroxyglycine alpha-amidating lyase family protein [Robiginitalea sp. SC105]|uniref:peptidyl-alpha-hydroxyglycine alpha-amidating lyase family protein n=1 Tax=Robiginitalea sp. SC105 TaxID=2762332 RepID=UPI001639C5BD|nr:peptidyl-alpha-hydroxyglycine alpha-amidating lyase family protein [Robiginitalea sp. SC105]MBC2839715.1 hypothetical protein [Robiginitalea sp. SC105]
MANSNIIKIPHQLLAVLYLLSVLLAAGCGEPEKKTPTETGIPDSYELVQDWPDLPEDVVLGMPTGLGMDAANNLVVFHRAGRPWMFPPPEEKIEGNTILTIDSETGKVLKSWGAGLFLMPHGLEVDPDNNIWITDVGLQQILKFNPDGELLLAIGEATVLGNDSTHFALPTDVASARDGSFYVSDGYGNSRVVNYSGENTFLFEWGENGPDRESNRSKDKGGFNTPHGIDLDPSGNVYVADRENNRIQKFDAMGKFQTLWQNTSAHQLYSVAFDPKNELLFAIDYDSIAKSSTIFRFDLDLNLQMQFNNPSARYHDIAVDDQGNLYLGDILENKIQKFRPVITGKNE